MKILLLDIETAPNLAYCWGIWEQNIATSQIVDSSYVLCWAAKWLGEKEISFSSVRKTTPKKMLQEIHKLLDEADAVVHYNGTKFDIPTLNKEFLMHGMTPPAPYKQIDLLRVSRGAFRFQSHKLDYVSQSLGFEGKTAHTGFQLWVDCMANKPEAWKLMEKYNKMDVTLLENVYHKFLPWIKNHPNHSLFSGDEVCTHCGSKHYQSRGVQRTVGATYHRYQCKDCGGWFKGQKSKLHPVRKFTEA